MPSNLRKVKAFSSQRNVLLLGNMYKIIQSGILGLKIVIYYILVGLK